MRKVYIELKGKTPGILMNNPEKTLAEEPTGASQGPVKHAPPDEQAKIRRYLLPDGNFYLPADALRKCILDAAKGWTVKGESGRRVALRGILGGSLLPIDPGFPLLRPDGEPISGEEYDVFIKPVGIGMGARRSSILRGRPQIWPWRVIACFHFGEERVELEVLTKVVESAGVYPGILDYRPEKGGWFGTFDLVKIWLDG